MGGRLKVLAGLALLAMVGLTVAPGARADMVIFPVTSCHVMNGTGCSGSLGSVTVASVGSGNNEVSVTLTLGSNTNGADVFAFGGAGQPLLFDVLGSPGTLALVGTITSNLTTSQSFAFNHQSMTMADGTGKWNYFISCTTCGTGTSMSTTGPGGADVTLTFELAVSSGTLTPASFVANNKGYVFATDVGIPTGGGNFNTCDVAAVPLPATAIFLISALLSGAALTGRLPSLAPIARELAGC